MASMAMLPAAAAVKASWAEVQAWPALNEGMWAVQNGAPGATGPSQPVLTAAAQARVGGPPPAAAPGGGFAACEPFGPLEMVGARHPLRFFYTRGEILIMTDGDTLSLRRIFMDGRSHDAYDPSYAGISDGHWEGKTLVVTTTDLASTSRLAAGLRATTATRLLERFEFKPPNHIHYTISISDPGLLAQPLVNQLDYVRQRDWDLQITWCNAESNREQPSTTGESKLNLRPPE
jgi:hypothetical protein